MYPSDGFTRKTVLSDIVVGNVVRMINPDGSSAPFSDCIIVKENNVVELLRPMGWSNGKLHAETFSLYPSKLIAGYFQTVLKADGNPYTMIGT
jgi:hypothetical protein